MLWGGFYLALQWYKYLVLSSTSKSICFLPTSMILQHKNFFLNEVVCISMLDTFMFYPQLIITVRSPHDETWVKHWTKKGFLRKRYVRFLEGTHSAIEKNPSLKTPLIKGILVKCLTNKMTQPRVLNNRKLVFSQSILSFQHIHFSLGLRGFISPPACFCPQIMAHWQSAGTAVRRFVSPCSLSPLPASSILWATFFTNTKYSLGQHTKRCHNKESWSGQLPKATQVRKITTICAH